MRWSDDQGQGVPDPHNGHGRGRRHEEGNPDVGYDGYHPHHGLDPLPPNPMDLLGNLVEALCNTGLQANPGC